MLAAVHGAICVSPEMEEDTKFSSWSSTSFDSSTAPVSMLPSRRSGNEVTFSGNEVT